MHCVYSKNNDHQNCQIKDRRTNWEEYKPKIYKHHMVMYTALTSVMQIHPTDVNFELSPISLYVNIESCFQPRVD